MRDLTTTATTTLRPAGPPAPPPTRQVTRRMEAVYATLIAGANVGVLWVLAQNVAKG